MGHGPAEESAELSLRGEGPNRRYADRIEAAEATAAAEGRGLWGEWGFTCRPADFRRERC